MFRDVPIAATRGIVVLSWRSREDGLTLRVRGQNEELRLVCTCGRSHWVVREYFADGAASLVVTCHSCGTRGAFTLEGVSLPAP